MNAIGYSDTRDISQTQIIRLYKANEWSAVEQPEQLFRALVNSHGLITAWTDGTLIGLGNAISDGHLVVYYPHLLVLPKYQGQGIGKAILERLKSRYAGFHQHMLVVDESAVSFYRKLGFERAGSTEPMWIYAGHEH